MAVLAINVQTVFVDRLGVFFDHPLIGRGIAVVDASLLINHSGCWAPTSMSAVPVRPGPEQKLQTTLAGRIRDFLHPARVILRIRNAIGRRRKAIRLTGHTVPAGVDPEAIERQS